MPTGPTPRQVEVISALVTEGSCKAAARSLGLSPHTVHMHLAALRARLNVETTGQAIYLLTQRGVLVVPA